MKLCHALTNTDEAEAACPVGPTRAPRCEPDSVILDRDEEGVRQTLQVHAAACRLGVLRDVCEGFLDDPIDRRFSFRREASVDAMVEQFGTNAVPFAEPLQVPLRGRGETQIVEQRRMQQVRQIAHRMKHSVGD